MADSGPLPAPCRRGGCEGHPLPNARSERPGVSGEQAGTISMLSRAIARLNCVRFLLPTHPPASGVVQQCELRSVCSEQNRPLALGGVKANAHGRRRSLIRPPPAQAALLIP